MCLTKEFLKKAQLCANTSSKMLVPPKVKLIGWKHLSGNELMKFKDIVVFLDASEFRALMHSNSASTVTNYKGKM